MLQAVHVNKIFRTHEVETLALKNVSLSIEENDFISIAGPSGCGKSTLLSILGLIDAPTSGEILFDGKNVVNVPDREAARLRNEKIGFIFQNFHLIPALNVFDNVELPFLYRNRPIGAAERKEKIEEILNKVGLSHRKHHYPSQLSGGQCQRVAIARALVNSPSVLLADEPTGNLDSAMSKEIMALLDSVRSSEKCAIVMVTHDPGIAASAPRIVTMQDGEIVDDNSK